MSWNGYENNVLLRNDGCRADGIPRFTDVAMAVGVDDVGDSRGIATADFDNDGDLDIVINHNPGDRTDLGRLPAKLYRNDLGHRRTWIAVELQGKESNRDGVGAKITVTDRAGKQYRVRKAGCGYASQHTARMYFGLDAAKEVSIVSVAWPSGRVDTWHDIGANQLVRFVEGEGAEVGPLPKPVKLGGDPQLLTGKSREETADRMMD